MRKLFVLGVLLLVMLGLQALQISTGDSQDPLILAAIGFVVLAGFSAAELGATLQLPQVTGFIVCGVVLGPSVGGLLSEHMVGQLKVFNDLALGLIAITAGLELDFRQLRKIGKTLAATIIFKVLLCFVVVGGVAWTIQSLWSPLELPAQGGPEVLALLFGALAIGTSPAIVLAVSQENRAQGRLTDLTLGSAVAKDVVVVVAIAIAIALSAALLRPETQLDVGILTHFGREIAASVFAGLVLGGLLIAYIRFIGVEMLIFVAATVLGVSEVGHALHLEILLVFIVAGCVVKNASHHAHDLHAPLEVVALPVFVIFFTIAGANLRLGNTLGVLPVAFALATARLGAYWGASEMAGRLTGETSAIRRQAVFAYLPQAGVTLGLVGLAADKLPEISAPIETLGAAVVALHLLAGPFTLRRALQQCGEIPQDTILQDAPADLQLAQPAQEPVAELDARVEAALSEIQGAALRGHLWGLHQSLAQITEQALKERWEPLLHSTARAARGAIGSAVGSASMRSWMALPHGDNASLAGRLIRETFDQFRASLRRLPVEVRADLSRADLYGNPTETFTLRLRKLVTRLGLIVRGSKGRDERIIPLRALVRSTLEPMLATWAVQTLASIARAQARVFEHVRITVQGHEQADASRRNVQRDLNLVRDRVMSDLHRTLRLGLIESLRRAEMAGGPRMPGSSVRYSLVEPEVRECLRALEQGPVQWREGLQAAKAQLGFVVEVEAIRNGLHDDVDQHLRAPSVEVLGAVRTILIAAHAELVKIAEEVEACRAAPVSSDEIIERMQSWTERTQGLFPTRSANQIESRMARYRAKASIHQVAVSLRRAVRALPGEMRVTDPNTLVQEAARPQQVRTWRVDLRSRAEDQLVHGLLPKMDQSVQDISSLLASVGPRLRDAVDIAIFALEARDGELPTEPAEGMETAFDRAISRIARLEGEVGETAQQMGPKWFAAIDHHIERVLSELATDSTQGQVDTTTSSAAQWVAQQLNELVAPVRRWWQVEWRRAEGLWSELSAQSWSHELHVHFTSASLDAIALRDLTERWRFQEHLPKAYRSLFDGKALREKRLFSARGDELDALVSAERGWLAGGPSSALVIGEAGSGKSSLLNLAQLEFNVPRLLVPRPLMAWRETTVVGALAMELGCRAQRAAVVHVLRKVKTAVILDDLERWIEPNDVGTRSLTSLLDLIAQTREHVFWMVSINSAALQVLREVVPVRQTFGRVVELQGLSANDLMAVIEHRHRLSERKLRYPRTIFRPLLRGLERSSHRTLLAQVLNVASRGNLSQALTVWKRAVDVSDEGDVHPRLQRVLMVGLPSFRQLHAMELALLIHALRFRTVTSRQAASTLGHPLHRIQRHLGYLRSSGLLVAVDSRSEEFEIPRALLTPVTHGLHEAGVFG